MKALYLDLISGASGDMFLGALIDAGVSVESLFDQLAGLQLDEFELQTKKVQKNGFQATKVDVLVGKQLPERPLPEILEIINKSSLPISIQEQASSIFQHIGKVEAGIHNKSLEEIHLHELGGTDTIVDVTGTLLALDMLEVTRIQASSIPVGSGFIPGAHGQIPLPAPATLGILQDLPIYGLDIQAELVTPTGAALLAALVEDFGPPPAMVLDSIGYGAGARDLPIPNLLRALIGTPSTSKNGNYQKLIILETNLDDQNPEIYPYVMEQLFQAGALDVCLIPIQMKKNRPGTQIQVLADPAHSEILRNILFQETTTLGIREREVDRFALTRKTRSVATPYGDIEVKISATPTGEMKISPEYEDCRKLAVEKQIPLREIYRAAISAYQSNQDS
ncbi:MAG TPA: nickel pincer cofactor biosynthesis protein LarC [Chloroflexi bacterium]|nr:MAG: nickel pincer cofactor biosynthesis protein LarC [Chloroflexota bacterium]HDD55725.1 nickel pincer cofactor biosynthesis protein LarC [Chloroflexota bacterium]